MYCECTDIFRFKIENNSIKNFYEKSGKLNNVNFIFPINNEILVAVSGEAEFLGFGRGEKTVIKTDKKYKNLKDLFK